MTIFLLMLFGHALADYPLQGDFLARAKNHADPIPGVPWIHGLLWHSIIHGGAVGIITDSVVLGVAETLTHMLIDYAKCGGWFGSWIGAATSKGHHINARAFHVDQALHVACKVLWAFVAIFWSLP
jgi:hypothetical protein